MKRFLIAVLASGVLMIPTDGVIAATLQKAELTRLLNDVKIATPEGAARKAKVGDVVQGRTAVKTGHKSRAELKFGDETLARLGANTVFSFERGTRDLELQNGLILLQVPKNAGGAKIKTAAVTAAITGTTIMLEYVPGVDGGPGYIKVIVLEGTMRFSLNGKLGESVLLKPGEMLILSPTATSLPQPVNVDIAQLMATSGLAAGDFEGLPSVPLIQKVIATQDAAKEGGDLQSTNLAIFGRGTTVFVLSDSLMTSLVNRSDGIAGGLAGGGSGESGGTTPPGDGDGDGEGGGGGGGGSITTVVFQLDKFGRPPLISGIYTIDELTTIITDPFILRENLEGELVSYDEGTIYRDEVQDGLLSQWLFGSTSEFDDTVGIDEQGVGSVAGFRFEDLEIFGTPTFDTVGGPTTVALIAENNITVGDYMYEGGESGGTTFLAGGELEADIPIQTSAGDVFDLTGLTGLLLATVDGFIDVGDTFTFTGTDQSLTVYARGENGYLDFYGDALIPEGEVSLFTENSVYLGGQVLTDIFHSVAGDHFSQESTSTISANEVYIESLSSSGEGGTDINGGIDSAFQVLLSDGPVNITGGILTGQDIGIEAQSASLNNASITSTDNPGTSTGPGISVRAATGAINIENSSQLLALATVAGTRRSIHLSTQGGDITISGSTVRSSSTAGGPSSEARIDIISNGGAINIANSTVEAVDGSVLIDTVSSTVDGIINITGVSTIAGRDVKIRAAGPNGQLRIGGSTISADNLLELYADGTNGIVQFVGDTTLNFNTGKIGANTVQVDNGVVVTANGAFPIEVMANQHNYSEEYGGNGTTSGTWAGSGVPGVLQ